MATLRDMMSTIARKRAAPARAGKRLGRPPKAETEKLGEARFTRFKLEQEARIELHRQAMERRLLRKVDASEAIRDLLDAGLAAKRARTSQTA